MPLEPVKATLKFTFFDTPQLTIPLVEYAAVPAGDHSKFAVPAAAMPEQASTNRLEINKFNAIPGFNILLTFSYLSMFNFVRGVSPLCVFLLKNDFFARNVTNFW